MCYMTTTTTVYTAPLSIRTGKVETNTWHFGGIKKNWTDRDLSIVSQWRLMKAFTAIKFKQK